MLNQTGLGVDNTEYDTVTSTAMLLSLLKIISLFIGDIFFRNN